MKKKYLYMIQLSVSVLGILLAFLKIFTRATEVSTGGTRVKIAEESVSILQNISSDDPMITIPSLVTALGILFLVGVGLSVITSSINLLFVFKDKSIPKLTTLCPILSVVFGIAFAIITADLNVGSDSGMWFYFVNTPNIGYIMCILCMVIATITGLQPSTKIIKE